jgi:nitrate reductase NapE component
MSQQLLTVTAWKRLLKLLCMGCLSLLSLELGYALGPLLSGQVGGAGARLEPVLGLSQLGGYGAQLRILEVAPDSPLLELGAQAGASLRFERPLDLLRYPAPGELVPVRLVWPNGSLSGLRELSLAPRVLALNDYLDYLGRLVLALPAVLFALAIGLKRPEDSAHRCLALGFALLSLCLFFNRSFAPQGAFFLLSKSLNLLSFPFIYACMAGFALHYHPRPDAPWIRRLRTFWGLCLLLCSASALYSLWFVLGHSAPGLWELSLLAQGLGQWVALMALLHGWRAARGQQRQRMAWLLLAFAVGALPALAVWLPGAQETQAQWGGLQPSIAAALLGQGLSYLGLAYAVLRHRVFDVEFAFNRAVVYSVISVLLLAVFGVIKWQVELLLHGAGGSHKPNLLADGAVALGVYLVFHHLHERLEKRVESLFFHKWHAKEQALRQFVRQAIHIQSQEALLRATHDALERFTDDAGCVIYLRLAGGAYAQVFNSLPRSPHLLDADDALLVALRSEGRAQALGDLRSEARGALGLPMLQRGQLHGVVVLGHKPGGASYRPDELELLDFVVNQISLDLQALIAQRLQQDRATEGSAPTAYARP